MMKRFPSFLLIIALIAVMALPVAAADDSGGWIELLESTSVQPNGENWFIVGGSSSTITLHLPNEKRLAKIDMLVWHQTAERIQAASVTQGNSTSSLNVLYVGNNITRVYGTIPNAFYQDLNITFTRSGTSSVTWELLSCKVNTLATQTFACDSYFVVGNDLNTKYTGYKDFPGDSSLVYPSSNSDQLCVVVNDWAKYDSIVLFGSIDRAGVGSIRASVGNYGLPYDITFTQSLATGEVTTFNHSFSFSDLDYIEQYGGLGDIWGTDVTRYQYNLKTLYRIEIDLSGIDRTALKNQLLTVYFTYVYSDTYGFSFNLQAATGFVNIADTTEMNWWTRFTSFMTDLFGGDDPGALEDLGDSSNSISSNIDQIHGFEQSQQAVLDNNFAQIQTAVTFTNFAAALVFVQKYANMTFSGISGYAIVFTLPLFLGLFFYLCSRIPGITRWKTPPPRSKPKGGGKP